MMAALELAKAHTESRAIWGPLLAFAHGEGDKISHEPYKSPCAKDSSFGKHDYVRHAERLYDDVYSILTFYKKWTHVETTSSCHPVPSGTVSVSTEQKNMELRNRVIRNVADQDQMPAGTKLAAHDRNTLSNCP